MTVVSKQAVNADLESSYGILRYNSVKDKLKKGEEVYVPLIGFEDYYVISNFGLVKRKLKGNKLGKALKTWTGTTGYPQVTAYSDIAKKHLSMHHAVYDSFFINPDPIKLSTLDHINRDRSDYSLSNLMYASRKYQIANQEKKSNAEANSRQVQMLTKEGVFVKEHPSVASAVEWLKKNGHPTANSGTVVRAASGWIYANGDVATPYGYIWVYPEIEDLNGEIWKEVSLEILGGANSPFIASNKGRLQNKFGKLIKGTGFDKDGYIKICGMGRNRLMAMVFVHNDDPENKVYVNHKNGRKQDDSSDNLEWCTESENTQHAVDTGLNKGPVKATKITVVSTGADTIYPKNKDAAAALGVCPKTTSNYAKSGKTLTVGGVEYLVEYV